MVTRRTFIISGLGGMGILVGAPLIGGTLVSEEYIITRILHHYMGDQLLAPGAAQRFAKDFAPVMWKGDGIRALVFKAFLISPFYFSTALRRQLPESVNSSIDWLERRVITSFFAASDFRGDPRQISKPINYVFYNASPMCNPFARVHDASVKPDLAGANEIG